MPAPLPGKGTEIHLSIATVMTKISNVLSISPAPKTQATYQWEELDSDSVRRHGSGVADGGQLQFKVNYDPESTTQEALFELVGAQEPADFQLVYSDGKEEPFSAVVQGFAKDEITNVERVTATLTLDLDGVPDWPDEPA